VFDFKNLFVLDIANNHQGDIDHAKNIINKVAKVINSKKVKSGIKFQFRDLDSFIHPEKINDKSNKNIDRFLSTKLSWDKLFELKKLTNKNKLLTICTAFDECSVDKIVEMDFDIIKVASCSADDWPLLEKVTSSGLPIIVSTGGLNLSQIDNLVSFFKHKGSDFSIMHCVSIYPMVNKDANISFIKKLKLRYPDITIGWSTHEKPENIDIIKVAYATGARMYERHVGISSLKYKLNDYSSEPEEVSNWIDSLLVAQEIMGSREKTIDKEEINSLNKLKRGIFLSVQKEKGELIKSEDIYFAIPLEEGQLHAGMWQKNMVTNVSIKKNEPLKHNLLKEPISPKINEIKTIIHKVKGMLNEAKINLNPEFEVEFSHHFGVKKFNQTGAVIINCINREYCKKILVQLPGQKHPSHFHKKKEETFHLLSGDLTVFLEGIERKLSPGETCLVMPGMWHSFSTVNGCIFEEISTTHFKNDSVYKNPEINNMKLEERKTIVKNWGRFFIS
jgi:sialic acid synthase SpsE/quercetin dioxygenase-like cupin family protein